MGIQLRKPLFCLFQYLPERNIWFIHCLPEGKAMVEPCHVGANLTNKAARWTTSHPRLPPKGKAKAACGAVGGGGGKSGLCGEGVDVDHAVLDHGELLLHPVVDGFGDGVGFLEGEVSLDGDLRVHVDLGPEQAGLE